MTSLNKEVDYNSLSETIDFVLTEHAKRFYISIPAIVQSYDAAKRRCSAQPAVKILYEDGSEQAMPVINDIPVVMPAGGGYTITLPLQQGDSVLLCFCHRGIEHFKESFALSSPTLSINDLHDAVAIAGFGALEIAPASANGATMQSNDATSAVIVDNNKVTLKHESSSVVVDSSQIVATAGGATLTLSASALVCSVPIQAPSAVISGGMTVGADAVISGKSFNSHTHTPGSYQAGGDPVTGNSGTMS